MFEEVGFATFHLTSSYAVEDGRTKEVKGGERGKREGKRRG